MANVFKMFARGPIRWTTGRTALLSYPDWWTPSVHHKKGRPSPATSHESRPGKPSFCIFGGLPHRGSPRTAVEQITRKYRLGKPSGYYPNTSTRCYTMTRRINDLARSLGLASQITPQAQGRANLKIPTLQHPRSRHGDTKAAGLTDGKRDSLHIIRLCGTHNPPPHVDPATYATQHTQQHSHGLAGILRQDFKPPPGFHHTMYPWGRIRASPFGPRAWDSSRTVARACDRDPVTNSGKKPALKKTG